MSNQRRGRRAPPPPQEQYPNGCRVTYPGDPTDIGTIVHDGGDVVVIWDRGQSTRDPRAPKTWVDVDDVRMGDAPMPIVWIGGETTRNQRAKLALSRLCANLAEWEAHFVEPTAASGGAP